MRVKYVGMDARIRVAKANRIKFLDNGFQVTDKYAERDESIKGPVIVAHVYRSKGGKRLIMEVPEKFDMLRAQEELLKNGWLDLSMCTVKGENLY